MSGSKLPNYIRTYRKRAGLSQDEVAFLLGSLGGSLVCRYEQFRRKPTLTTALALGAIFRTPVSELFLGIYEHIERKVAVRAGVLAKRAALRPEIHSASKIKMLESLAAKYPTTNK